MKVDEDHRQMGPPSMMEGQHRVWTKRSVMKESHPMETAEFLMARGINYNPAFLLVGTIHP